MSGGNGVIQVTRQTFEDAIKYCDDGAKLIESAYDEMIKKMNGMSTTWGGPAKAAWADKQGQFNLDYAKLHAVLNGAIEIAAGEVGFDSVGVASQSASSEGPHVKETLQKILDEFLQMEQKIMQAWNGG